MILQPPILSPDFVATRKLSPREKYGLQKSSIGSPEDERPYRLLGLLEGKKLRKLVRQSSEQASFVWDLDHVGFKLPIEDDFDLSVVKVDFLCTCGIR